MTTPAAIGFIGVGTMGCPMAINLMAKGYPVIAFDVNPTALDAVVKAGATAGRSVQDVCNQARDK